MSIDRSFPNLDHSTHTTVCPPTLLSGAAPTPSARFPLHTTSLAVKAAPAAPPAQPAPATVPFPYAMPAAHQQPHPYASMPYASTDGMAFNAQWQQAPLPYAAPQPPQQPPSFFDSYCAAVPPLSEESSALMRHLQQRLEQQQHATQATSSSFSAPQHHATPQHQHHAAQEQQPTPGPKYSGPYAVPRSNGGSSGRPVVIRGSYTERELRERG